MNPDQKSEAPSPIIFSHIEERIPELRETLMRRIETIMRTLPARHPIVSSDTRVRRPLRDIPVYSANDARGWRDLSAQSASRKMSRDTLRSQKPDL